MPSCTVPPGFPHSPAEYSSVFHDRSCRKRWAINASLPIGLSIPRSLNAKRSLPVLLHDGSMTAWSQNAVDGVLALPPPFAGNPKTTPGSKGAVRTSGACQSTCSKLLDLNDTFSTFQQCSSVIDYWQEISDTHLQSIKGMASLSSRDLFLKYCTSSSGATFILEVRPKRP